MAVQTIPAYYNDAVEGRKETGYLLFGLENSAIVESAATTTRKTGDEWSLIFELTRAQTSHVTSRTIQQSPFQLAASTVATVLSLLATWTVAFKYFEQAIKCFSQPGKGSKGTTKGSIETPTTSPPGGLGAAMEVTAVQTGWFKVEFRLVHSTGAGNTAWGCVDAKIQVVAC